MGLNSSKSRRKVTKVTPMPSKEGELRQPCSVAVYSFQTPLSTLVSPLGRSPDLETQLPPLRETLHGQCPTGLDQTVRVGETSIIKQHPPRRLQKLEPFILAENIPADKYLNRQDGPMMLKAKKLEKGGQAATHPTGRRQYLLKMKMLEMKKEAELKRCLKMEARPDKPKMKSLHLLGTLEHMQGTQSSDDDDDLHSTQHDQTFNGCHGDLWNRESLKKPRSPDSHLGQKGKVETWLMKQQATTESSSDASSTDSNNWKDYIDNFRKPYRRPALVRTKTERITLFDEFFDKDF